jgi:hypothetical protein
MSISPIVSRMRRMLPAGEQHCQARRHFAPQLLEIAQPTGPQILINVGDG